MLCAGKTVHFACINAGVTMQEICSHHPRSILLTSGTLAPFSLQAELQTYVTKPISQMLLVFIEMTQTIRDHA